jgi:phosphoesterase RecJ-like protein
LAESFGGGGHKKAAGVTLNKSIKEAKKLLLQAIETMLKA